MAELTLANSLREKMLRDEVAYTLSVKLVRSVELPMMAKTAGFDGILIDMEHSSFDLDTTSKQHIICISKSCSLTRVLRSAMHCGTLRRYRSYCPRSFQRRILHRKSAGRWCARGYCTSHPFCTRR
jgi:hypothetical protein